MDELQLANGGTISALEAEHHVRKLLPPKLRQSGCQEMLMVGVSVEIGGDRWRSVEIASADDGADVTSSSSPAWPSTSFVLRPDAKRDAPDPRALILRSDAQPTAVRWFRTRRTTDRDPAIAHRLDAYRHESRRLETRESDAARVGGFTLALAFLQPGTPRPLWSPATQTRARVRPTAGH